MSKKLEKLKKKITSQLPKGEPFILAESDNEIRIYDTNRAYYYTSVRYLGENTPILVSIKRTTGLKKGQKFPLYRKVEQLVNEYNEEEDIELSLAG